MATPQVPPRPIRSQMLPVAPAMDIPRIPPRPKAKRSTERSVSPNRDSFARSPLNDPKFLHNGYKAQKEAHIAETIARPPSVTLPSIGQEGMEYASLSLEDVSSPAQTSNVAGDLPLHQPKASVPASTAKSRIQTVTRTDSSQAAAAGIGKLLGESDKGTTISSAQSDTSAGTKSRPQSIFKDEDEHGIPEIGIQVPMYPNAGDVQAPTPSPFPQGPATGVGFFNNGSQPSLTGGRNHVRTKSGRKIFTGPPGSYGLHGHGVIPQNHLEKSWYEKHPEDAAREMQGEYGPAIQDNRKDYQMSKEDLNKLVQQSAKGIGLGTSRESIGTPDDEIGYLASEEYASRMASPRPTSSRPPSIHAGLVKQRTGSSQTHAESPLRQTAFPANQLEAPKATPSSQDQALESEAEDDVIHIDPINNKLGAGGSDYDLLRASSNTSEEDLGYKTPILASDEVAKNPSGEFMQPAVLPELERRGSGELAADIPAYLQRRGSSRPQSSSNSVHSAPPALSRLSSTDDADRLPSPLGDVQEYEPLFPDDSDEEKRKKPKGAAEKLKRPDLARHYFPSQDVWEDTPSSLQLETTVESPDPEEGQPLEEEKPATSVEKKGAKAEQKGAVSDKDQSFLAETHLPAHMTAEMTRPGMVQRFPSQDIWEDAPDHVYQYTTVESPEQEEGAAPKEGENLEASAKPAVPTRPQRSKNVAEVKESSPIEKKAPVIPERPKPQVPARPSKPIKRESSEEVPLTKTISGGSDAPKTKPAVPARPGGKISALKAGFLNDLNQKLGLGPQAPKVKEPEKEAEPQAVEEKAPLADARKGRAKGPQRRKPASSPSGAAAAAATTEAPPAPVLTLSFAPMVTVFSISDNGTLAVPQQGVQQPLAAEKASDSIAEKASEPVAPSEPEAPAASEEDAAPTDDPTEADEPVQKSELPESTVDKAAISLGDKPTEEKDVADKDDA